MHRYFQLGLRLPEQPEMGKLSLLCLIENASHKSEALSDGTMLGP